MYQTIFVLLSIATLIVISFITVVRVQTQDRSAQDQSWNRRVTGTGDYQTVLEVSGRVEVTRALKLSDGRELKAICTAKQDAERRAFLSAEGYLSALEKSVDANRHQPELARGWKDDNDTLPILKDRATKDDNYAVRQAAVQELARGWKDDNDTLPWLKDRATNDNSPTAETESRRGGVRQVAIVSIARGWPDDPDTLALLREREKNDPTPWLWEEAKQMADELEARGMTPPLPGVKP